MLSCKDAFVDQRGWDNGGRECRDSTIVFTVQWLSQSKGVGGRLWFFEEVCQRMCIKRHVGLLKLIPLL